jgi:hypothetical protein
MLFGSRLLHVRDQIRLSQDSKLRAAMASAIQQELVVQSTNACGLALHKSSFPQRPLPESIDLSLCYPAMQLEAVKLTEAGELQSCSA